MPITSNDVKMYRSAAVGDAASNGGRLGTVLIQSGVSGNIFPNVPSTERSAGSTKYRKLFFKNENAGGLTLYNGKIFMDTNTPGDDKLTFFPAAANDTQASITGSERKYGTGLLSAGASQGATSINVNVEDGAVVLFVNGDLVRITDKATPDGNGSEEWLTITGVPVVTNNNVAIPVTALPAGFSSGAKVSSMLDVGDVVASIGAMTRSVDSGTINAAGITTTNKGCIDQQWTITFTSSSAFNIVGDTLGLVGTGNVTSGGAWYNTAMGADGLNLPPEIFSGVFATGNWATFATQQAATAIWVRRVVPAGSAVQASNTSLFTMVGETA